MALPMLNNFNNINYRSHHQHIELKQKIAIIILKFQIFINIFQVQPKVFNK